MKDLLFSLTLPWLPKNWLSFWIGRLTLVEWPDPLGPAVVRWFARRYKIRLEEAEHPITEYKTINALFTRRLKPGMRPLGQGILHPADARITEFGMIEQGRALQVKGQTYSLAELLGSQADAQQVEGGVFITYYLCPTDYHRVHCPMQGEVLFCRHIPGQLWPVNPWSVRRIQDLFAVNERTVTAIQQGDALAYVVMVGATNVGKITMSFDARICTNQLESSPLTQEHTYAGKVQLEAGSELGIFNMGSTVVMLYNQVALSTAAEVKAGPCKMGAALGTSTFSL